MSTRADRKAEYQAYRKAAADALTRSVSICSANGMSVRVEATAGVSLCEDGAYVDAVIWVPRAVMERAK